VLLQAGRSSPRRAGRVARHGRALAAVSVMAVALSAVYCTWASIPVPTWPAWTRLAITCGPRPCRKTGSARRVCRDGDRAGVAADEPPEPGQVQVVGVLAGGSLRHGP
jgi:hypothetical protein